MSRIKRLSITALAAALLLGPSSASAGTAQLKFTHDPTTTVVEYLAVFGLARGSYSQERSLGVPSKTSGVFTTSIEIPDNVEIFIAIVAVDRNGTRSAPSNERLRFSALDLLGAPGQPMVQGE
jgi:hypothetical protein